jgi:hypothetical protein
LIGSRGSDRLWIEAIEISFMAGSTVWRIGVRRDDAAGVQGGGPDAIESALLGLENVEIEGHETSQEECVYYVEAKGRNMDVIRAKLERCIRLITNDFELTCETEDRSSRQRENKSEGEQTIGAWRIEVRLPPGKRSPRVFCFESEKGLLRQTGIKFASRLVTSSSVIWYFGASQDSAEAAKRYVDVMGSQDLAVVQLFQENSERLRKTRLSRTLAAGEIFAVPYDANCWGYCQYLGPIPYERVTDLVVALDLTTCDHFATATALRDASGKARLCSPTFTILSAAVAAFGWRRVGSEECVMPKLRFRQSDMFHFWNGLKEVSDWRILDTLSGFEWVGSLTDEIAKLPILHVNVPDEIGMEIARVYESRQTG